ncbi:UDP-2,3-diacylglucosamine diphosphatase [Roseateles albus]|uniref:UDP-2,3-diacylglucosamine hydrolase n=1 Tax=Roseateles albus TaxID=2987525 RepID=A0ABT5KAG0_9BURK|nr:UDP-2,3-diacylglucosamine diphosphatase [Roseateles albus]MDC8770916.1 UDP-2,3-diacylglucosamine diphosphatase [Roseateles albus]
MNSPKTFDAGPAKAAPSLAFDELTAPPEWRRIEFLSDLHLSPHTPATLAALQAHLQETSADAVLLLGDIFEVWVGDDARFDDFEASCLEILRSAGARLKLYFMAGNRDFLLGPDMLKDCGAQALSDPTVLCAFGQRWLLTHGDALCLADSAYQAFRTQVRTPQWQAQFLAQPLAVRRALAQQMRDGSKAQQAMQREDLWADLDTEACLAWLKVTDCKALIHGHTHRPAEHVLAPGLIRHVLSDWDFESEAPRGDVLRLRASGLRRIPLA